MKTTFVDSQYARARGSGARAYIENLHTDRGYRSTSAEALQRPLMSELPAAVSRSRKTFTLSKFGSHTSTINGLSGQVNLLNVIIVNVSSDGGTAIGR